MMHAMSYKRLHRLCQVLSRLQPYGETNMQQL